MSVLVGKKAPDFIAPAVMPDGQIKEDFQLSQLNSKFIVLFFWPLDFTFVCPTEIIAHDRRIEEFKKRETEVVGVSIDSQFTHFAWRNTPVDEGGIGQIRFPIVSDIRHIITRRYGVEHKDGVALRASFLIDKDGVVQHQVVNNLSLGRNVDEMLRMIDAQRNFESHGEVCPAGWHHGDEAIKASNESLKEYLKKHKNTL
jgi:peroxiredoxin (alkyl hydroperoxide reductase subunit C)